MIYLKKAKLLINNKNSHNSKFRYKKINKKVLVKNIKVKKAFKTSNLKSEDHLVYKNTLLKFMIISQIGLGKKNILIRGHLQ